ncbi:uncharacterized protein LOC144565598 [Carex rostrata]
MSKPFSSPQQQEGHFRNSVSDGGSPRGAVPIPSDPPVIPMTISQNTHGVGVVCSPSSQDGHFTRDHNTCQPTKARTSQNTPVVVSPDGHNRNKCFISGADGSGQLDHQATMKMNGEDVPKKQCPCGGGTCIVKTSHTEKNPNRLFYKCPAKICNFFQWCDGLGPSCQSPLKPDQGCSRSPGKIIKPQNTSLEPKNPTCSCKAGPCIVQTMHEGENKGRKYYACPIKKGHGACKHFEWVDSLVKPPETESNSKIHQNNMSIDDVATPEPKQTLSPYESVNDPFGENDNRTIESWCKEKDPNSTAATGTEINKQLSPGTIRVDSPVIPPEIESNSKMWLALKQKFDGTSITKLRQLTIKFDTYKKRHNHSVRQHLREMSNMISELKDAGHVLTDEQQLQAVIRSLPHTWEHMKVNLTNNESVTTFNDAARHLELEEDRIEASKPQETESAVHLAGSSSNGGQYQKRKSNYDHNGKQEKKHKGQDRGKGKASQNNFKKHNKVKIKCFNCDKKGHYARECKEPHKTQEQQTM